MLEQKDDLDESIIRFTEATCLPRPRDPSPTDLTIVQIFGLLTLSIFLRARMCKQPDNVKCCIVYLRYLRGQRHDVLLDPRHITMYLVLAIAIQVELELGNAEQDIEEMVGLCDELFNSDVSRKYITLPIMSLSMSALRCRLGESVTWQMPSEKLINCLRKAIIQLPDSHDTFLIPALLHLSRFQMTHLEDDYKDGMVILDKVMNFRDPGGRPSPCHDFASVLAAVFAEAHFEVYGKPEYLEQAIYLSRTLLDGTRESPEHPGRPFCIKLLSRLQKSRHYDSDASVKANIQDAWHSAPGFIKIPSFHALIARLPEVKKASKSLPVLERLQANPHEDPLEYHRNALSISSINYLTDIADIEDGIEYCRQLNASYPDSQLACIARLSLCSFFWRAYECTNEIEYLNKAISVTRDHIKTSDALKYRLPSLLSLTVYLSVRLLLLRHREDLNELMQLFPMAAKYDRAHLHHRYPSSSRWASIAHYFGHPSALTAYDLTMSLMQLNLTLAPTIDKQHSRLSIMVGDLKTLPLDCASYQMSIGRPEQAIETLERGRALLWSEMRGLRTTVGQIRSADCHLAEKFATVSRDLEALTLALDNVNGGNSVPKGMDAFGHLVTRQRKLLNEREELISKIQALPGCDTFLKPHSYDTLCGAACHGPIIIINHSRWRSDIVILLHNSPPSLITTSDDFYARANKLQDRLLGERRRPEDLESNKYNDALSSVLKELYELVGIPVIRRLNELNVPLQSRVWWCPTSVFCSLPLHAMGDPIRLRTFAILPGLIHPLIHPISPLTYRIPEVWVTNL